MLNERLDLTADNEAILYIKMALKNIDFALISLDHILNTQDINLDIYKDVYTYYFYYLQKTLTVCGNIANVFYNKIPYRPRANEAMISPVQLSKGLRRALNLKLSDYSLIFRREVHNTNRHSDERYDEYLRRVGDYNIIDENTPDDVRREILNTPHLRTYNKQVQVYITVDSRGREVEYPLRQIYQQLIDLKRLLDEAISNR